MKNRIASLVLLLGYPALVFAAEFSGYVIDEKCSAKPVMKGNEACARKCLKDGSPAVLLSSDAKVYKLDDQSKVTEHAGHKVKIVGTLNGDTIKVESIVVDSGCVPGPTGCQ